MPVKTLSIVVFSLIAYSAYSQEWFPIGASWYYNQFSWFPPITSYKYFEVAGDTIIQDKQCRIVTGECECSEFFTTNFLYEEGDRVYAYDVGSEEFRLLYDFTLVPGDTLYYYSTSFGDTKYLLDSVSTTMFGGATVRVQHLSWVDGIFEIGTTVYEYIGSNRCLYPLIGVCDPGTGDLRCYEDPLIGLQKFIGPDIPCDFVSTSVKESALKEINIAPNPATVSFSVTAELPICDIDIVSIQTGVMMSRKKILSMDTDHAVVDVQDIPPGTYVVRLHMCNGEEHLQKLVILRSN